MMRLLLLVAAAAVALILFTPVGNAVIAMTAGLSPGDEGTLELRGLDRAYVADDVASLRALVQAARINDPEGAMALQLSSKVTPVPLHTRVRVLSIDAIDRMPVAQVRLFGGDGVQTNNALANELAKLLTTTGWVPAEWISRTKTR